MSFPNEVRRLRPEEFSKSITLLQHAFNFESTEQNLRRLDRNFALEAVWGVFEGEVLQSQLCTLDFDISINGQAIKAGGVTRVSSYPEVRRGGNVSKLFDNALKHLRDRGASVAMLIPFNVPFYRRLGWELVSDYQRLKIRPSQLPDWSAGAGRVFREEPSEDVAADISRAYSLNFNGTILRTPFWWREVVRPRRAGSAAVHYDEAGRPAGYVLYTLKNQPSDLTYQQLRGGRELVVQDIAYRSEASRRQLWNFLKSHETMVDTISVTLPLNDSLPFELLDPEVEGVRVPYSMARIIDVATFLSHYRFAASGNTTKLIIDIIDERAEWNRGQWLVRIAPDGVATAEKPGGQHQADLSVDIGGLTSALFGYIRPHSLARTGRLSGLQDAIDQLEVAIPRSQAYLPEFF